MFSTIYLNLSNSLLTAEQLIIFRFHESSPKFPPRHKILRVPEERVSTFHRDSRNVASLLSSSVYSSLPIILSPISEIYRHISLHTLCIQILHHLTIYKRKSKNRDKLSVHSNSLLGLPLLHRSMRRRRRRKKKPTLNFYKSVLSVCFPRLPPIDPKRWI